MKRLLLTALLLAAPAATAQTTSRPTPSVQAIPATPPATAAPGSTSAVTLRLSAQPGTTAQLSGTVQSQITLEDVQVSGPGGQPVSAAETARLRAQLQQGLNAGAGTLPSIQTNYQVQGRAAGGARSRCSPAS
ncbi:hypothetical protein [Deinococcus sp. S9]|uniref:hypothetical protein n=1 Tax=Deinococcus sp. S9 TaxID=2545754 RepID=UPI0010554C8E|nr:hypothetical protein [Deinococcus sp. S9]TDE86519.1 hypothetical protein E0686_05925 [Deinococcus sp. S9]